MPEQIKMPENSIYLQKIKTPGKNKTPAMLDEAPRSETPHQLTRAVLHPSVLAPWNCHHHINTTTIVVIIIIICT